MIISWLKGLVGGVLALVGTFLAGLIAGKQQAEKKELENDLQAAETRAKVNDNVSRLDPIARRRMLNNWAVRGVGTDPPDGA
jgi:hypothetical protein